MIYDCSVVAIMVLKINPGRITCTALWVHKVNLEVVFLCLVCSTTMHRRSHFPHSLCASLSPGFSDLQTLAEAIMPVYVQFLLTRTDNNEVRRKSRIGPKEGMLKVFYLSLKEEDT